MDGMDLHLIASRLRGLGRGETAALVRDTGLAYITVRSIREGKTPGPQYTTLAKIQEWLDRRDARLASAQQAAWSPQRKQMG